jgi:FAD:protein FMN transferase
VSLSTPNLDYPAVALAREAMATRFEIVLPGANSPALRAAGEEALDEIERLEGQLSLYRPTSEIAYANARAAHEPVRLSPPVFRLLIHAQQLHLETAGAFDITVAPLVRGWGMMNGSGTLASNDLGKEGDWVGDTNCDRCFTVQMFVAW